jgi:hypothetical protein
MPVVNVKLGRKREVGEEIKTTLGRFRVSPVFKKLRMWRFRTVLYNDLWGLSTSHQTVYSRQREAR